MNPDEIHARAKQIYADYAVDQQATLVHGALVEYFNGEDPTGKILSGNIGTYAAFIAVLTASGPAEARSEDWNNWNEVRKELAEAFKQAGFVNQSNEFVVPERKNRSEITRKVGPLLPEMVAILEIEHGIDPVAAVREHLSDQALELLQNDEQEASIPTEHQIEDWEMLVRDAPGFDATTGENVDAYIYVLELERIKDCSTWYYVGRTRSDDLAGYIRQDHGNEFTRRRTVIHEGREIIDAKYRGSTPRPGTTHRIMTIERVNPIPNTVLSEFDDPRKKCYTDEQERRIAFEVALEYETTNILGGR